MPAPEKVNSVMLMRLIRMAPALAQTNDDRCIALCPRQIVKGL
jgi:hypothetical protein